MSRIGKPVLFLLICTKTTEAACRRLTVYESESIISHTNHTYGGGDMATLEGKYTWTATVGEKGQIVIPKQARDIFGIKPGDTLLLLGDENRGIAIPSKGSFAGLFSAAFEDEKEGESK